MKWETVSFDWNQVRAFLATVEEGSLSAAARVLRLTQPTLSRQVSALEESLGVILFERGTRAMTLTEPGLQLVEHVRAMGEAANRISLAASGQSQSISGQVRISATDSFATRYLPTILRGIRERAPAVELTVVTSNQLHDIAGREADIAIRHVRPTQPELIAKLVRETSARFHASSAYLDRVGRPKNKDDLSRAEFIGWEYPENLVPFFRQLGVEVSRSNFPITTSSGTASLEMIREGLGIGFLVEEDAVRFPELELILPEIVVPVPIWLVTHRELNTSPRIRLVFDLLAEGLANF